MTEAERAQKQSRLEELFTEQHFRPASNTEEKLKEYAILNNELHDIPIPERFNEIEDLLKKLEELL